MSGKYDNTLGMVRISNNVIGKIAGFAASSCYGVVGMSARSSKDDIARLLKREMMDRGVKIKLTDSGVEIAVFIIVEYGINISAIGDVIRSNVKYNVEQMTGLDVTRVDVNVDGIRVE